MSILFTQHWDLIPGAESEYMQFIAERYIPETEEKGFHPVGGYYVEVGFGPRIVAVYAAENLGRLTEVVDTSKFRELTLALKSLVYNYVSGVYAPTGNVKHEDYSIQKGVWKFNQYYDLKPGMKKEYADFIINEHVPTMKKLDYLEVTGGWNVLFGGFSEIIAEFTFKDPIDIARLLNNEDFRKVTLKLRSEFVINYKSRILRCTERFDEARWFRL